MKAILARMKEFKNVPFKGKIGASTIGKLALFTDDFKRKIYECYTCECDGPSTNERGKKKRILPGYYTITWREGTKVTVPKEYRKPTRRALWLHSDKLESFDTRYILIHIGNVGVIDSQGCILVGKKHSNDGLIQESTIACKELFDIVDRYGTDNFIIEIVEAE